MKLIQKTLRVEGMLGEASEWVIENALTGMDGVEQVKASFADSCVRFSYDPSRTDPAAVARRIAAEGYRVPKDAPPGQGGAQRRVLQIRGMTCTGCEERIERVLRRLKGVKKVRASYKDATAEVEFDPGAVSLKQIAEAVEKLDYRVILGSAGPRRDEPEDRQFTKGQLVGIGVIILAVYLILKNTVGFDFVPNITQNMGYGLLFVVGLLTSLHCVAMCGGINLSQCISASSAGGEENRRAGFLPSLLYNSGRVVSYTLVGGIVGALGSVVSFSGTAKGIVAIAAGLFMVLMGLNLLNVFPWLRRITPHLPRSLGKFARGNGNRGPFFVGLLNGLMPCGPLQAMQLYALGTGSAWAGALSMFVFSLGTVPLMFGFGALSSLLSRKFTHKMMKVSAVLVMLLGVVMLNRGFALSGLNFGITAGAAGAVRNPAAVSGNVQTVTTSLKNGYEPITVQTGVPVKWIIQADAGDINGCNGTLNIPAYNISKTLQPGDNEIDFTPQTAGTVPYSCWMGMIRSSITVVDDLSAAGTAATGDQTQQTQGTGAAGGCCGQTPAAFAGGKVPTDRIGVAKIENGVQEVTVQVDNTNGYTPAVLVLQKGVPAVIRFDASDVNSCTGTVEFPEYNGSLDLSAQKETPKLTVSADFTFQCSMGMLHGYVKVVDDLNKVDLDAVRQEVANYTAPSGGGCCG